MKKQFKIVNILVLITISISTILINTPISKAAKNDSLGFIKTANDIGLKADGSLWSIPQDDDQKYSKLAQGYKDIDSDAYDDAYIGLKKDGSLWVWGKNTAGQFAESKLKESKKPIKIMDKVKAISGLSALKNDGSVWTWGGKVFRERESKKNKPICLCKGATLIAYGSKCVFIIDKNSTLYAIRNYYCGAELIKGNRVKIADKVKFVANNYYITNDKKLWEIQITGKDMNDEEFIIDERYDLSKRLVLTNVIYTDSNHDGKYSNWNENGTSCAIKTDGSLWIWGMDFMPYKSKCNSLLPQKLMNDVKSANCGFNNIQIIKKDGSVCYYGFKSPKSLYSIPIVFMKDIAKVYDNISWVLTKDDTLMWETYNGYEGNDRVVTKNASKNVELDGNNVTIKNSDGTKVEYIFDNAKKSYLVNKYKTDFNKMFRQIVIKNDNTMWQEDRKLFGVPDYVKMNIDGANIKSIYQDYGSEFYIQYNDNSLWVCFLKPSETDDDSIEIPVDEYHQPVKLLDDFKDIDFNGNYTFAITNSGELYCWAFYTDTLKYDTQGKKIMDGIDCFDSYTKTLDIIKKDKSRWNLAFEKSKGSENFNEEIAKNAYKDIENMEEIKSYCEDFYIKTNGELCVRGYGDDATFSNYRDNVTLNFGKVLDNVISANHDSNYDRGLALCVDGSLWEYGEVNAYDGKEINTDIRPRKVMDDVEEFKIRLNTCAAVKGDGSLFVWGYNQAGQVGNGNTKFVEKPQKILDNVDKVYIDYYGLSALKKDGTLMKWGLGTDMFSYKPFTNNPVTISSSDNKISNNRIEAVGLGEEIPVCVKVKDKRFTKSAKLVLESGKAINLDKSVDCNFTGKIPGIKKAGVLKYHIVASDDKGNEIKTDEYKVQILNNEKVLIDSKYGEFIAKDYSVFINGDKIISDFVPLILMKNGKTLFTETAISSALKADIKWEESTKTLKVTKEGNKISMKIGSKEIMVNGKKVTIDSTAIIVDGMRMLPLGTMCKLLGAEVSVDVEKQSIVIKTLN